MMQNHTDKDKNDGETVVIQLSDSVTSMATKSNSDTVSPHSMATTPTIVLLDSENHHTH